jgi:uncharacterized protein (TIGR03118 family)
MIRWFRRIFPSQQQRCPARWPAFRPTVEGLEDRFLLSANAVNSFFQNNLISDIAGIAQNTDPNLVNPWGLAFSDGGPLWVADNGSGLSTIYNAQGQTIRTPVTIPPPAGSPGTTAAPTGVVFNDEGGFRVTGPDGSGSAMFIFATEDGTISAFSKQADPNNAILEVDNSSGPNSTPGAVYKGLALADSDGRELLFAANFRSGQIDIFNSHFHAATVAASNSAGGAFHDPNLPAGFAPFDIQEIDGQLYVTYAKQDDAKHDDVAGAGNGFIDVYSNDGFLIRRLVSGDPLNSPWGLALAPSNFGAFSGDLLVGNFGDGHINAFDPTSGTMKGTLDDVAGNPITIGGLWSLKFGSGKGSDRDTLFFTAGIDGEHHGLVGSLQATDPAVFGTNAKALLQTNLASDIGGIAQNTDVNLKNPWGISSGTGGPFWVSVNGSGVADLFNVNGTIGASINPLIVNIPGAAGSTANSRPTGQVFFGGGGGFDLTAGNDQTSSVFLFATESGTIAGWNPGVDLHNAVTKVDNSAAGTVYTGLALGSTTDHGTLLYAANNARGGTIDVFDTTFKAVNLGSSAFVDPHLSADEAANFSPYNIQNINGLLYVTYSRHGEAPAGATENGFIDVYNTDGKFLTRFATAGPLNSPWGLALAPKTFGAFGGDLLVGNEDDGHINAYSIDPKTGAGKLVGTLKDGLGNPITIGGLWGLKFGSGGKNGDPNTLYFTAGIGDYQHGLFGALQTIEPIHTT